MEEKESVRESEIDLRAILQLLKRNLALMIVVTLVFGVASYLFSRFFLTKKYEASATIIVNNLSDDQSTINSGEIIAAQNLADVYAIIIKSDTVLQEVINRKKLSMSYEQLKSAINVSTVNSTQVVTVSMRSDDAERAKDIIACVVDVAPPIIKDRVEAGSVEVLTEAKISNNGNPVSPDSTRNAILGAAIGLLLTLALIFVKEMSNNTFKTEEDITNMLKIPVLGIIPSVDTKEFNKNV